MTDQKAILEPSVHAKTRQMLMILKARLELAKEGQPALKKMYLSKETYRDLIANSRVFDKASNQLTCTFAGIPYRVDPEMKPYDWRLE